MAVPGHHLQPWTPLARSCFELLSPGCSLEPPPKLQAWQTFGACGEREGRQDLAMHGMLGMQTGRAAGGQRLGCVLRGHPYTQGWQRQAVRLRDSRVLLRSLRILLGIPGMQRTGGTTPGAPHPAPDHRIRAESYCRDHQIQPLTSLHRGQN